MVHGIDSFVQDCDISIANTLEIQQSCIVIDISGVNTGRKKQIVQKIGKMQEKCMLR